MPPFGPGPFDLADPLLFGTFFMQSGCLNTKNHIIGKKAWKGLFRIFSKMCQRSPAGPSCRGFQLVKEPRRVSPLWRRKGHNLFSAAACTWTKILLTLQTCELTANGGYTGDPAEAPRSGFGGERRHSAVSELSPPRRKRGIWSLWRRSALQQGAIPLSKKPQLF